MKLSPGTTTSITGCVIRFGPRGPLIHANASHANVGIDSVEISDTNGRVHVRHRSTSPAIVTCWALPDETLVARGVTAGISGGTANTSIQLAVHESTGTRPLDLRKIEDYRIVHHQLANLWVGFVHLAEGAT